MSAATTAKTFPAHYLTPARDPRDRIERMPRRDKAGREFQIDYMRVDQRLAWFISDQRALTASSTATGPYSIICQIVEYDKAAGFALVMCTITDVLGNQATALGSETAADWRDYIEKAETKARGRALAALGYGTVHAEEDEPIADAPISRPATPAPAKPITTPIDAPAIITPRQIDAITKLCAEQKRRPPASFAGITQQRAAEIISELTHSKPKQPIDAQPPDNFE